MDSSTHNLRALFLQLGLENRTEDIDSFITEHKPLPPDVLLSEAGFWRPSQASFLREAILEDSDWCAAVDELDTRLRG